MARVIQKFVGCPGAGELDVKRGVRLIANVPGVAGPPELQGAGQQDAGGILLASIHQEASGACKDDVVFGRVTHNARPSVA
jgi:hypothetical protein